jgi:hypothetical protein
MKRTQVLPHVLPLVLVAILSWANDVCAQKAGGILRRANDENPPSASLHEEGSNIVTTANRINSCPIWRRAGRGARTTKR